MCSTSNYGKGSRSRVEEIASYSFVERVDDGDAKGTITLNVSRSAILADVVENTMGFNGSGIKIAILDTGVDVNHPSLDDLDDNPTTNDPKVIVSVSFVDFNDDGVPDEGPNDLHGHGTHVAGIAAGTGHNSPHVGVAPGAWIMNVKVIRSDGLAEMDDVEAGIDFAVSNGADVINLSLGFVGEDELSTVSRAADRAVEEGVVVVVAAGNEGHRGSRTIRAPGNAFNVITVGAIDDRNTVDIADDTLWGRSSRGPTGDGRPKPDVVAPGVNIWSAESGTQGYRQGTGTSMAAPHVAGTVALMLNANPNLTPAQVKAILRQTARLNTNLEGLTVNDRGHGIIDAFAAVQLAQNVPNINRGLMYDSWEVTTPRRHFDMIGKSGDYLNFTQAFEKFY